MGPVVLSGIHRTNGVGRHRRLQGPRHRRRGKIDEASDEVGAAYIVVDTGPWIFGRQVILPVGTIDRVDHEDEGVYVDLTKDQIKDSPELAEGTTFDDPAYRRNVGDYYGEYY